MSEVAQAAPQTAATATETPATTPANAAAPVQQPEVDEEQRYPWLASRLGRERNKLVKQLGLESLDEAKALLDEAKRLKAERLSETERMQARIKELESLAKDAEELRGSVAVQAKEAMSALTQAQREAVEDLAGESPSKQLKAIAKLRPTWAASAPAPLPPPASTAPATSSAPAPTASHSENHLATWERLKSIHPIAAAYYLDQHQIEISEARKARK